MKSEERSTKEAKVNYPRYNLDSLLQESTEYLYQKRLDEYLTLSEDMTFEETYNNLIDSIQRAAQEALGMKQRQKSNKIWWTEEIAQLIEKKKKIYKKWLSTKSTEDKVIFNNIKNKIRRKINQQKTETWDRKCQKIESYIGGRQCTEAWKFINRIRKNDTEKIPIQSI